MSDIYSMKHETLLQDLLPYFALVGLTSLCATRWQSCAPVQSQHSARRSQFLASPKTSGPSTGLPLPIYILGMDIPYKKL